MNDVANSMLKSSNDDNEPHEIERESSHQAKQADNLLSSLWRAWLHVEFPLAAGLMTCYLILCILDIGANRKRHSIYFCLLYL
jgi:hypothetical protein